MQVPDAQALGSAMKFTRERCATEKELEAQGWQFLTNEPRNLKTLNLGDTPQTKEQLLQFYLNHGCNAVTILDEAFDQQGNPMPDYYAVYVR